MANSGYKNYLTLKKYVNGIATTETKNNTIGDADYIAPVLDTVSCPTTSNACPEVSNPLSDIVVTVGAGNETISLNNTFYDSNSDSLTYTATSSNSGAISASISGSNLILSYLSGTAASSSISVTASDGTCTATDTFNVTLNEEAATPPTWNCVNNSCVQVNDGTGTYSTLSACQAACATTTAAPCPPLITIQSASFNIVQSSQSYTTMGGYCAKDNVSATGSKWYIDTSSSTPDIYSYEFTISGPYIQCPVGTSSPIGTNIQSWNYGTGTITPQALGRLWNTGIEWTNAGHTYDVILETSSFDVEMTRVHLAPRCSTTTVAPTTQAPTAYTGLVRCDDNTTTWYTNQTISSGNSFYSAGLVCYISTGTIYDITGKTFLDGTEYSPGAGGPCDCDCYNINCGSDPLY